MLLSEYKSRIKEKFEGGNALSIDWYTNAKEAGEAMREQINPTTLKRSSLIYGGLYNESDVYYCPSDVSVPSALYNPRNTREQWEYMPPQAYYDDDSYNRFTIESLNGGNRLHIRNPINSSTLVLDEYDSVGTKVGTGLSVNKYNFLSGSGAIQGTFDDTNYSISDTFDTPIDITPYNNGIFVLPANVTDWFKVESVKVKLYTTSNDFYTLVMDTPVINGWNMIRIELNQKVQTGFPVDTNIISYSIEYKMKTGESQTIVTDRIALVKTYLYKFEYYSNNMFIDKDTGSWVSIPAHDTDIINLSEREASILIYEGCRIVALSNLKQKDIPPFDSELMRKYKAYWNDHPSSALPISYTVDTGIPKKFIT